MSYFKQYVKFSDLSADQHFDEETVLREGIEYTGIHLCTFDNHRMYRCGDEIWPITRAKTNRIITCYALHFVLEGNCKFNGIKCSVGDSFVCTPGIPHTICADGDKPFRLGWFLVSRWYSQKFRELVETKFRKVPVYHVPDITFTEICGYFEKIFNTRSGSDDAMTYVDILMSVFSHESELDTRTPPKAILFPDTNNTLLQNAKNYIDEYFCEKISIKQIADYIHISPSQLFRIFKKELGVSPQNYILSKRMEEAIKYLKSDFDIKFRDIANNIGYSSYSNFEKYFKLYFGCSPKEYRDNIKK